MEPLDPADPKPVLWWTFQLSSFEMSFYHHIHTLSAQHRVWYRGALREHTMNDRSITHIALMRELLSCSVYPYLEHNYLLGVLNY